MRQHSTCIPRSAAKERNKGCSLPCRHARNSMMYCTTRPIRRKSINFPVKRKQNTMTNKIAGGLAGIVAGETAISTAGKKSVGLTYLGSDIQDLAPFASFEEGGYL